MEVATIACPWCPWGMAGSGSHLEDLIASIGEAIVEHAAEAHPDKLEEVNRDYRAWTRVLRSHRWVNVED